MKDVLKRKIYESPQMWTDSAVLEEGFALSTQDNSIDNMGKWTGWEPVDENN